MRINLPEETFQDIFNRHRNKIRLTTYPYCWDWIANKNEWGYGLVRFKTIMSVAHKVFYSLYYNKNYWTLKDLHHKCENKQCVNPLHLKEIDKPTHRNLHRYIKIKESNKKEFVDLYIYGFNMVQIGTMYNLCDETIRNVLKELNVPRRSHKERFK